MVKVGLQEQLRGIANPETIITKTDSVRTLRKTFGTSGKGSLRNEPMMIGQHLVTQASTAGFNDMEIHKSYSRLHALKHSENLV